MMNIAEIQQEARKAEREKIILIVQGLLNEENNSMYWTSEEHVVSEARATAFQNVLNALA